MFCLLRFQDENACMLRSKTLSGWSRFSSFWINVKFCANQKRKQIWNQLQRNKSAHELTLWTKRLYFDLVQKLRFSAFNNIFYNTGNLQKNFLAEVCHFTQQSFSNTVYQHFCHWAMFAGRIVIPESNGANWTQRSRVLSDVQKIFGLETLGSNVT